MNYFSEQSGKVQGGRFAVVFRSGVCGLGLLLALLGWAGCDPGGGAGSPGMFGAKGSKEPSARGAGRVGALERGVSGLPLLEIDLCQAARGEELALLEISAQKIPALEARPEVDGVLDEAEWSEAVEVALPSSDNQYPTTFRCGYTDQGLVFGVVAGFDPQKGVVARFTTDGAQVWRDDAVFIALAPAGDGPTSIFWINPNGTVFAARGGNPQPEPAWQRAVQVDAEGGTWVAELVVPFSTLGLAAPPAVLRANFGRSIPGIGEVSFVQPFTVVDGGELRLAGIESAPKPEPSPAAGAEAAIRLDFARFTTVPGERWLEGAIRLEGAAAGMRDVTVRAAVFGIDHPEPLASVEAPAEGDGALWVNLRDLPQGRGRVRVEALRHGVPVGADEAVVGDAGLADELELAPGWRIPVLVDATPEYRPQQAGLTFGVAFPAGSLWTSDGLRVIGKDGAEIPSQITTTAQWFRDGSVKWARVDALAPTAGELFIELRPGASAVRPQSGVLLNERPDGLIEVETAGVGYVVGGGKSPIHAVAVGDRTLAAPGEGRGLYVIDQKGRLGTPAAESSTVTVEAAGPVEACVKIEGPYLTDDGEELARHVTRLEFFAGTPRVKIYHTLILSRSTREIWLRDYGWELDVDAGNDPQAWFGTALADWRSHQRFDFGAGVERISMLQKDHVHYFQGENVFEIAATDGSGRPQVLARGEESGDWAALVGTGGGLLLGCRNAARLHPKEFAVEPGRVNLMLFSPNAGMELDFNLENRIGYINLRALVDKSSPHVGGDNAVRALLGAKNDALGWSRTHELTFAPVPPAAESVEEVAAAAGALSFPVFATADPAWLCASQTMGDMNPYDPERFPQVEAYVEDYVRIWREFMTKLGEFGILDFGSGPHFARDIHSGIPLLRRYMNSYSLKDDLWFLYARRGDRFNREFAELSNRFFLDSYMIHWDEPGGSKRRGLYARGEGSDTDQGSSPFNVPIHWGSSAVLEVSGTSDLGKFLFDYYLTGYRRGRDVVEDYGRSAVDIYTSSTRLWRPLRFLNEVVLAYGLDWNPALRDIAGDVISRFHSPSGAVGLKAATPYGSTYKTQSDFKIIWRAYNQLRDPRLKVMLDRLAEYHLGALTPNAFDYQPPYAYAADYLFKETGDPSLGEYAMLKLRGLVATVDSEGRPSDFGIASSTFASHGFAIAQRLAVDTGAWLKLVASYSGLDSMESRFRWFFSHEADADDLFRYSFSTPWSNQTAGVHLRLKPAGKIGDYAYDLKEVALTSRGRGSLRVPPDVKPGIFQIEVSDPGTHALLAGHRVPLVLNIEGFWRPTGLLPLYFAVPVDSSGARIFLEKPGVIRRPDGASISGDQPVQGWVDLPPLAEGLYRLEGGGLICGENFPPYYVFGDPGLYFVPEDPDPMQFEDPAPEIEAQASYRIGQKDRLVLPLGGLVHGKTPIAEGTIEFYYRPEVDAVEMDWPATLLLLRENTGEPVAFHYYGNREAPGGGRYRIAGRFPTLAADGKILGLRPTRPWFFRRGQWNHVALTWGDSGADKRGKETFKVRIFVNGRKGRLLSETQPGRQSILDPAELVIGPGMPGEITGLRFSERELYTSDFTPPKPEIIELAAQSGVLGVADPPRMEWKKPAPARSNSAPPLPTNP